MSSTNPSGAPGLLDRLRRFDPAVLPILVAAAVLVGTVVWLLTRPLPQPQPAADTRQDEQIAALRGEIARLEGLAGRVAGLEALAGRVAALEPNAARIAALEGRTGPDLAPLREAITGAAGRAEAAERRAAEAERQIGVLEERLAATARDLAARPQTDPNAFAPRAAVEALTGRVEALARETGAAAQAAQARVDALAREAGTAAQATQGRVTAAEQAIAGFAGRVAASEAALGARTQAIETQAGRIGALEQAMTARIAALEAQIAARTQAAEAQAARIAALEGAGQRLAALEGRSARLAALDAVRGALEAGRPLGEALRALPNPPEALARFANAAPPTEAALRLSFDEAARAARAAGEPAREGAGVFDSAVSRLSGLVTVRRGEEVLWGDAANAEIERARRALEAGDLEGALRFLSRLSPPAREAMRGWIAQAEALVAARAALRQSAAG